jgi:hypothetical protein
MRFEVRATRIIIRLDFRPLQGWLVPPWPARSANWPDPNIVPRAVQFHCDGSGGKCHGKWNRFWKSARVTARYPVLVSRGEDGHLWPFPALAGIRPGIYAGLTGGRDPSFVDFVPAVRPVYGSPSSLYDPVPCRHAIAKIIDWFERITELETAFLGRNPVNGVDIADSAKNRFHAILLTRHECRADYRLKPKTGVNARA